MGTLISNCRECGANEISFGISGFSIPKTTANRGSRHAFGYVFAVCSRCERPSLFEVDYKGTATWEGVMLGLHEHVGDRKNNNLSSHGYAIIHFTSKAGTSIPANLPGDVEKAFTQGETNYAIPGHEEAAATMYRRALERALKHAFPDLSGQLAGKIKALVAQGTLPKILGDWATEVRLIGNDGAHDEEVKKGDLDVARAFADAFLRYLISLPAEVEKRRQTPSN